eukprot:46478-Eustigmatos_ZCMA.PRE.1
MDYALATTNMNALFDVDTLDLQIMYWDWDCPQPTYDDLINYTVEQATSMLNACNACNSMGGGDPCVVEAYQIPAVEKYANTGVLLYDRTNRRQLVRVDAEWRTVVPSANDPFAVGPLAVNGSLHAVGDTTFGASVGVTNALHVGGSMTLDASAILGDKLDVAGAATVSSAVSVSSNVTVGGHLAVTGPVTFSSTLG